MRHVETETAIAQTGSNPDKPTYVAIKGTVFDVSKNSAYGEKGSYRGAHSPMSLIFA